MKDSTILPLILIKAGLSAIAVSLALLSRENGSLGSVMTACFIPEIYLSLYSYRLTKKYIKN